MQSFVHILFAVMYTFVAAAADTATSHCKDPSDMAHRFDKLFISQPLEPLVVSRKQSVSARKVLAKDDVLNSTLPWKISLDRETNERALCPWYYEVHHNANRLPSTLAVAASDQEHCVGPNGELSGNRCERVFYNVRVIRRKECIDGTYVYEYGWERIPVSYVCVYPEFGVAAPSKNRKITAKVPKAVV